MSRARIRTVILLAALGLSGCAGDATTEFTPSTAEVAQKVDQFAPERKMKKKIKVTVEPPGMEPVGGKAR